MFPEHLRQAVAPIPEDARKRQPSDGSGSSNRVASGARYGHRSELKGNTSSQKAAWPKLEASFPRHRYLQEPALQARHEMLQRGDAKKRLLAERFMLGEVRSCDNKGCSKGCDFVAKPCRVFQEPVKNFISIPRAVRNVIASVPNGRGGAWSAWASSMAMRIPVIAQATLPSASPCS